MRPRTSSADSSPAAGLSRERPHHKGPRPRPLPGELLEDRRMLALASLLVDLQSVSDSGLFPNENLANVRTAVIDITAAKPGDTLRVYRGNMQIGQAEPIAGPQYRYTFTAGQLLEGPHTITARSFGGTTESADSPALISISPQTVRGTYRITVGPSIADLARSLIDHNAEGSRGEARQDQFTSCPCPKLKVELLVDEGRARGRRSPST